MSIELIPDLYTWIFWGFFVAAISAGIVATAVVLGAGFRHYSRLD